VQEEKREGAGRRSLLLIEPQLAISKKA